MLLPTLILALGATVLSPSNDGEALLRRMNEAHRASWFKTMIFVQHTTYPAQPERAAETWYETMDRPGMLRIDVEADGELKSGMIFRNDTLYQFSEGAIQGSRPMFHPLLILLHDIHVAPNADAAIGKLVTLGFDLSVTSDGEWNGKPVVIVGSTGGDMSRSQFWVDAESLVVVRVIQSRGQNVSDTHIGKFSREGDALVERDIRFNTNGSLGMVEEYTWVKTGVELDAKVFDPAQLAPPTWIAEYKRTLR